jgi:hypothetical protein
MYFVNGCVNVNVNVYSETHRSHNLHIPKLRANNQKLRANNQFVGKITKRLGKITKRLGKITKSLERFGYFPYKLVIRPEIPRSRDSAEIRRK